MPPRFTTPWMTPPPRKATPTERRVRRALVAPPKENLRKYGFQAASAIEVAKHPVVTPPPAPQARPAGPTRKTVYTGRASKAKPVPYGSRGYRGGALPSDAPRRKVIDTSTGFDPGSHLAPADLANAARQRRQNLGTAAVVARGVVNTAFEATGVPSIVHAAKKGQIGNVLGQAALFGIPGGKLLEAGTELTRVAKAARAAKHILGDERNGFIQTIHAVEPDRKSALTAIAKVDAYVHTQVKDLPKAERAAAAQKMYARIHRAVPSPVTRVARRRPVDLAHVSPKADPYDLTPLSPHHGTKVETLKTAEARYARANKAAKKAAGKSTGKTKVDGKTKLLFDTPEAEAAHETATKTLNLAKRKLGSAQNDELYARAQFMHGASSDELAAHPHFAARQSLVEDLFNKNAGLKGALSPSMGSELGLHHVIALADRLATAGEHGRMWYENSAKSILALARGDKDKADKIAQLFAIYSPQQGILGNTSLAIRAYNQFLHNTERGVSWDKAITAGTESQREKAAKVLANKGDWEGRKTNNFYVNFLEDINSEKFDRMVKDGDISATGVTADLWMARAFGYLTDQFANNRYDVVEKIVQRLGEERGWKPKQAQAAIWTAIKNMSKDVSANIDFATGIERHMAQINYEAAIGTDPALRAAYDTWAPEIQQAFLNHKSVLVDEFINDVGLLSSRSSFGPGVWNTELAPGAQLRVGTSAAPRIGTTVSYRLAEDERNLLTVTTSAIARALKQESAGWVRASKPLAVKAVDLLKVRLGRTATDEEAHGIASTLGGDFAVIHTNDGLLIKQIGKTPLPTTARTGDTFHTVVADTVARLIDDPNVKLIGYAHDGELAEAADYASHLEGAFGDGRGSGEGLRFVRAADRLSREADAVDAAYVRNPERAARTSAELAQSRLTLHGQGDLRFHDPHGLAHGIPIEPPTVARPPAPRLLPDEVRSALQGSPGVSSKPASVVLADGSRHQVNPLHPVSIDGGTVNLLDGNEADTSLVTAVHAGDGSVVADAGKPAPVEPAAEQAAPVAASPASAPRVRRATHGPKTIEEAVVDALHGAPVSRHEQQALRTPENARRLDAYGKAVQEDPTAAGHAAAKKLLAGKYPTLHWGNFEEFNAEAADAMHKFITDHPAFEGWIKVHAKDAIDKARSGVTPTRYEEKVLRKFFGPDVTSQIMRSVPGFRKLKARLYDILNIPRAVMASFDISGAGRQGLLIGTQHPGIWAKNLPGMLKALGSKEAYHAGIQEIHSRPNALNGIYDKMGLDLTDLSNVGSTALREEAFATPYADMIPGVKMSGRAYHYFLDKARADLADHLYAKAVKKQGKLITRIRVVDGKPRLVKEAIDPDDPELLQSIGDLVNSSSGRGDLGEGVVGRSADGLNLLLFSPRLAKSRIDFLNPVWYAKLHPLARHQAYKAMSGLVVMMSTVLGIAKAAGASVNLDPRSSDFAKVKIGNTRLDFGGGFQQYIRILSELATQQTVNSAGEVLPMGPWRTKPGLGKTDDIALLLRFLRGKLAPIPSTVWNVGSGENLVGEPTTARSTLFGYAPLSGQDAWKAAEDTAKRTGSTPAAVLAGLGAYGFGASGGGIQTYAPKPKKVPGGWGSSGGGGGWGGSSGGGSDWGR